jgi:hypothetical protein
MAKDSLGRKKYEAEITTRIKKYMTMFWPKSCAWEVKVAGESGRIYFNQFETHQLLSLQAVANRSFSFKIGDHGFQNPFDGFTFVRAHAYVILVYPQYSTREFFVVPINAWIQEECTQKARSVTHQRASELGYTCVLPSRT